MKINNLTNGLFAALLIASPMAGAGTDYPAADFQPQIVYQDAEYIKKGGQSAGTSQSKTSKISKADPKYPAANFEPEVIYQDTDYKPSSSASRSGSGSAGSSGEETAGESGGSSLTFLIGLVIISLSGFYFFKKQPQLGKTIRKKSSAAGAESGGTGVSRYLRKMGLSTATGVERYLEGRNRVPVTGVAKYMAKRVISAKQVAAQKATGVEKYLRTKG